MANKDMKALIDEYLSDADWRIKENSNVGFSIGGMILHAAGAVTASKWLNDIYPKHIADAHKNASIHIHDLSMLGGYCAGWSLRQLLTEGLGGVVDKISSKPASHLSTACNQIVNFLGTMQNEWAGAQALSSFDTYLAPFIKWENLSDKEIRQCLQSFLFGVNTPSRWGCVPIDTEVLTTTGWKKYNEVQIGDEIATFNMNTKGLEFNAIGHITIKPNEGGVLHEYRSKDYSQQVTPDHRVLTYAHNSTDPVIRKSDEIFSAKTPYSLPIRFFEGNKGTCNLSDAEIQMAAFLYADGNFDFRGDSIHKVLWYKSGKRWGQVEFEKCCTAMGLEFSQKMLVSPFSTSVKKYSFYGDSARKLVDLCSGKHTINPIFYTMSERQAKLFLNTWIRCDGDTSKFAIQYDCSEIADVLQFIAVLAGYTTYKTSHKTKQGVNVNYIKLRKPYGRIPSKRSIIQYDGLVWCPTVKNGTAVFRRNQSVFISGQCQAPFTNVTFDVVCPDDMKGQPVVIGGEFKDFTYGDCQEEMDRLNSIYLDILEKGDASGRGFQYPIPTYNITEETQWDSPVMQKVFSMAAKYGTPYFQNFLGSDLEPNQVRSMALLGSQEVIYRNRDGRVTKDNIQNIVKNWFIQKDHSDPKYEMLMDGRFVPVTEMFQIPYSEYKNYVSIALENGYEQHFSWDHKCLVLRDEKIQTVLSQDVLPTDKFLLSKKSFGLRNGTGTYDAGKILGYYLAEGWKDSHSDTQLSFAININQDKIVQEITDFFQFMGCKVLVKKQEDVHIFRVSVYGKQAVGFVNNFIAGDSAKTKRLAKNIWDADDDFRRGIYDGYYDTDGCRSAGNFAHTTNKKLVKDLIMLSASLGKIMKYSVNKNNTRYFKPDKSDLVRFTSYRLDEYTCGSFDGYYTVPVKEVRSLPSRAEFVYNFTVDTPEHLFELPNGIITHQCCRLRLDKRELRKRGGGLFGSDEFTGSLGVVTINLPQIAYLARGDRNDFFARLKYLMDISKESLEIKRKTVQHYYDMGLYPYTKRYLRHYNNHFNTIGICGMNEACINLFGYDITSVEGKEFAESVLDYMRDTMQTYQEETGNLYNLEATPAESTSYRLAKHDKRNFPDIITSGGVDPFYTNSSQLPVDFTTDIFDALDHQESLQMKYTGGTVFHAMLGEKITDWRVCRELVKSICTKYRIPYFTISPVYSICAEHGYLAGEHKTCPECGAECEVYARIVGYYRSVKNWNAGKAEEYKHRLNFVVDKN